MYVHTICINNCQKNRKYIKIKETKCYASKIISIFRKQLLEYQRNMTKYYKNWGSCLQFSYAGARYSFKGVETGFFSAIYM